MKRLLVLLPLLTATTANAAPVYLTCKDATRVKTRTVEATDKPNEVTTASELQERKVFLDITANKATVSRSTDFLVEADPLKITLIKNYSDTSPSTFGPDSNSFGATKMVINRATLSYDYSYSNRYSSTTDLLKLLSGATPSMLARMGKSRYSFLKITTEEKASGSCKKVEAPAANQI